MGHKPCHLGVVPSRARPLSCTCHGRPRRVGCGWRRSLLDSVPVDEEKHFSETGTPVWWSLRDNGHIFSSSNQPPLPSLRRPEHFSTSSGGRDGRVPPRMDYSAGGRLSPKQRSADDGVWL